MRLRPSWALHRRHWLARVALGGAGLWLSACGGGGSEAAPPAGNATPATGSSGTGGSPAGPGTAGGGTAPGPAAGSSLGPGVVVVGHAFRADGTGQAARLWREAGTLALPLGSVSGRSEAHAVVLEAGVPVVAGHYPQQRNFEDQAVLWPVGQPDQTLAGGFDGDHRARSLALDGDQRVVAGTLRLGTAMKAVLWRQGAVSFLSAPLDRRVHEEAAAVQVAGGETVVVGHEGAVASRPCLWRQGVKARLGALPGRALALHLAGGRTWVAGYVQPAGGSGRSAALWRDGVLQQLGDGVLDDAIATGIAVEDAEGVHVCGVEAAGSASERACLWKDGVAQVLEGAGPGSWASAVQLRGGEVWVAGHVGRGSGAQQAVVWRNGRLIRLGDTALQSTATALALA